MTQVNVTGATGFVFDWAYNPDDGQLYGGDSTQGQLAVLDVLADAQGLRFDGDAGPYPPGTLGELIFGDCVSPALQGLSVNQVLELAHGVLSSCERAPSAA